MKEIAQNIYIEDRYPGLVLGAIKLENGLVLVDAPFRNEDILSWRTTLSDLSNSANRLLVISDAQIDRTIGLRGMESIVLGHQNVVEILQNRSSSTRPQDIDAGAGVVPFDISISTRWMLPEITYTDQFLINLDNEPIRVSHHPGSHIAGSWVQIDAEKVLFVGDSVATNQPPFLAWADLGCWIADLELLLSDAYQGYKIISARQGRVYQQSIKKMLGILIFLEDFVKTLVEEPDSSKAIKDAVPSLLKNFNFEKTMIDLYRNRLVWGLEKYLLHHYVDEPADE